MGVYQKGNTFKTILEDISKSRIEKIGMERYIRDYSTEVDSELDDLLQYNNLSRVVYPLYKILSLIPHDSFELLLNGRPVYSIVMYLAGLSEYDRVSDNEINNMFYKAWAFKHISRSDNSALHLGLEFNTTSRFLEELKATLRILKKDSNYGDLFRMLDNKPVIRDRDGEYWLGSDVLFLVDKELDFLKQLQEESGLSVSELGIPDSYDMLIPSGFDIPHDKESRPIKSMFREDAYEMIKHICPRIQNEDIFDLVEHLRLRKTLNEWFVNKLMISGMEEDFLKELIEIKYFPSKLNMVGRYIISWRLDQYRKKVPDIYYKNIRVKLGDSRT